MYYIKFSIVHYTNADSEIYLSIYPNNTRDVYLYIYSVSAYMG